MAAIAEVEQDRILANQIVSAICKFFWAISAFRNGTVKGMLIVTKNRRGASQGAEFLSDNMCYEALKDLIKRDFCLKYLSGVKPQKNAVDEIFLENKTAQPDACLKDSLISALSCFWDALPPTCLKSVMPPQEDMRSYERNTSVSDWTSETFCKALFFAALSDAKWSVTYKRSCQRWNALQLNLLHCFSVHMGFSNGR